MNTGSGITVIQSVTTSWTKKSRGAPGAIRRNSISEAFRIPLEKCGRDSGALIEHLLGFYEWRSFEDPQITIKVDSFEPKETIRHGCVLIQKTDNGLHVSWEYTPEDAGMPLRPPKKTDVFNLCLNQWGRVIYNGRFSNWEGGWWYRKTVLNIGLFENPLGPVFVETSPNIVLDKMADLW